MEKLINSVGLSWLYDQIKLDLINVYNLLKEHHKNDFDQNYKDIDASICHIAKIFYLLEIPGGVFFINEFRLTVKYLVENEINNTDKIADIADYIEDLLNYIEDIIQGYGDLPLYYISTLDELRVVRHEILFSQCSYIVNSVKQHNISDFPNDFNKEQQSSITTSLTYISQNYLEFDKNYEHLQSNIKNLKQLFKGTQHYLLWDLLESYAQIRKNYKLNSVLVYNDLLKQIVESYNKLNNNFDFERISKPISEWIASLAIGLLNSGYFNLLSKELKRNITRIVNMTDKKSLNNYMAFSQRMLETDSWILLLDIASELDIAINKLQESKHKKRIDINWLIELIQKHIDSCVLTGTYEPLEHYYNAVKNISQYTIAGGLISSDDLEVVESYLVELTQNNEQAVNTSRAANTDEQGDYAVLANETLSNINQNAEQALLKEQLNELEEINSIIISEQELTSEFIITQLRKITSIFNLVSFSAGQKIVDLYINNLEQSTKQMTIISASLKQNIIVFIKYLSEIIKALAKNRDISVYLKPLNNLSNDVALAGINNRDNINDNSSAKRESEPEIDNTNIKAQSSKQQDSISQINTSNNTDYALDKNSSSSLKQIFFEEFNDISESITGLLVKLKAQPNNIELVESLQRELHTLKGASRMVGFVVISDWVHHLEEMVNTYSSNIDKVKPEHVNTIDIGFNKVNELIGAYKVNIIPALPAELKLAFDDNQDSSDNTVSSISVASFLKSKQGDELHKTPAKEQPAIPLRQNVRVSKDELDDLLDSACELVIDQHQLSQQNNTYTLILNKLKKVTDLIADKSANNSIIDSDIEQLRSIIKQMHEIRTSYYAIVDNSDYNVNSIFNKLVNFRMVPINAIRERLEHLVDTIAADLNKSIKFTIRKSEGSIDRVVLEQITPCLEHLIRNAIDHGIETEPQRRRLNKEAVGNLELNMYTQNQTVIIELLDDGSGLDIEKIKQRAVELNIIDSNVVLNPENIIAILTTPKFTTAHDVSLISGRGIGLNVVKDAVTQLCGTLALSTEKNIGTKFTMQLPYSMAKQDLLFIKLTDLYYALPSLVVDEVKRIKCKDVRLKEYKEIMLNMVKVLMFFDPR
jgi:signal transduction histidine kinase/HPt (histidine-containing phosphotransfer) domain-containing protein